MVAAITRACGVQGEVARAWADAWERLGHPDMEKRIARRDAFLRSQQPLFGWWRAAEISIPGILYIRLERCPRWLPHAALTAAGAVAGWLAARYPGLLPG